MSTLVENSSMAEFRWEFHKHLSLETWFHSVITGRKMGEPLTNRFCWGSSALWEGTLRKDSGTPSVRLIASWLVMEVVCSTNVSPLLPSAACSRVKSNGAAQLKTGTIN